MAAEPPGQPPPGPPTEPTRPLRAPVPPRVPLAPPVVERVVEPVPPVYPVDPSWTDNPWPVLIVALLALLIGGLLGYLIGDKGESGSQHSGPVATQTVTHSSTVVQPKTIERTVTAPAPTNTVNEERRVEAETALHKAERENERLKHELENTEGG